MSVNLALRLNGAMLELYNSDTGQLAATLQADISHSWATTQIGTLTGSSEDNGSAASIIHQASLTLDHDDIRQLPTAAIQIAGAPGSGLVIISRFAALITTFSVAYSGIAAPETYPGISLAGPSVIDGLFDDPDVPQAVLTSFLTTIGSLGMWTLEPLQDYHQVPDVALVVSQPTNSTLTEYLDTALTLAATNNNTNFAGGHADNILSIGVEFRVIDVATGRRLTTEESGWDETTRTFA